MDGTQILTLVLGLQAHWILKDQHLDMSVLPYRLDLYVEAERGSSAPLSLVVRWPSSSTRMDPLQDGIQGDTLSPIADGSLGSGSWRNTLILQENAIRVRQAKLGHLGAGQGLQKG